MRLSVMLGVPLVLVATFVCTWPVHATGCTTWSDVEAMIYAEIQSADQAEWLGYVDDIDSAGTDGERLDAYGDLEEFAFGDYWHRGPDCEDPTRSVMNCAMDVANLAGFTVVTVSSGAKMWYACHPGEGSTKRCHKSQQKHCDVDKKSRGAYHCKNRTKKSGETAPTGDDWDDMPTYWDAY